MCGGGNSHDRAKARTAQQSSELVSTAKQRDVAVRPSKVPLVTHFASALGSEVGEFVKVEVKWGMIIFGFLSVVATAIRLGQSWGNIFENLVALFCASIWGIFWFAAWVIFKVAQKLWHEGLPYEQRHVILTDGSSDIECKAISFRGRLVFLSSILIVACLTCSFALGLVAYRTAALPVLTSDEISRIGRSIVVGTRLPTANNELVPPVTPLANGVWINHKYILSCLSNLPKAQRTMQVLVPVDPQFSSHMVVSGAVAAVEATVQWRDQNTNIAILRVYSSPFDDVHLKPSGHEYVPSVAVFSERIAKSGEQIFHQSLRGHGGVTAVESKTGTVLRTDADFGNVGVDPVLYLSVPSSSQECGSPVIDERGTVIGVVYKNNDGNAVALTSGYVQRMLRNVDLAY